MGSWAALALPWFQIVGTVATAVAAVAASRSASAARFTAGKGRRDFAPGQPKRSAGPLCRHWRCCPSGGNDRSREPQQMTLYVRKRRPTRV